MTNLNPRKNRISDIIGYLVDDQVGIIRHVDELPRDASEPRFFHFSAEACNTSAFARQRNFGKTGGASIEREAALSKAVGEAVERYCSAIYDQGDWPFTSYASADFTCVPPREFSLYSDRQYNEPGFPYSSFDNARVVRWAPTQDLVSDETWFIPASMVFLPYYYCLEEGEEPIVQPISTGLACHGSIAEATISAICEVIERDAFTITWQARLAMPHIRIESLSDRNRGIVARLEQNGSKVVLVDITLDIGVPTILAILRAESTEAPALVFAASADLDPERAVAKSLEEVAHTRQLAQDLKCNQEPIVAQAHYKNIVHQDDHVLLYCDHRNVPLADFIWSSRKEKAFNQLKPLATGDYEKDQKALARRISALGYRVLIANVTTPDIESLGLAVVRAIIPGFHPLFMGHRFRSLGGTRLYTVPQQLGYRGLSRDFEDNPAPHPYP
jgi:ribosomal protein S12 methylthiotransferase accessory factor